MNKNKNMNNKNNLLTSALPSWQLKNRRVFLRVDLNVPLAHGKIINDFRLRAIMPTLNILREKEAKIILATHMGRPQKFERLLSTEIIAHWLNANGYQTTVEEDLSVALKKSHASTPDIVLLENLRFYPGEKARDAHFAHQLRELADFYVNDAFALLHRSDTSITLLPELFEPDKRTIGHLIEQELKHLYPLKKHPALPYLIIMGGGKVADKIPLLMKFIDKVSAIALCPALVFTFLKARGYEVGTSLVDNSQLKAVSDFIVHAQQKNVRLLFPEDILIAHKDRTGPLRICPADSIPSDAFGISIGPKSEKALIGEINNAQTILFNAAMGFFDRPETLEPTKHMINALVHAPGFSLIGGGESAAAAQFFKLDYGINYISTGGGATLAYLSGCDLPGLNVFM